MRRLLNFFVLTIFCLSHLNGYAQAINPGQTHRSAPTLNLLPVSQPISHAVLKGITVNPDNPLDLQFIIDTNNDKDINKDEAQVLINYFFAGLTLPESDLWVNLSPNEANRIIPDTTATTQLGEGLLSQDYLLKQLSSSLTYPETEVGKRYWEEGNSNNSINSKNSLSKVWIKPNTAKIYEHGNSAFVSEATLKVEMDINSTNSINSMDSFKANILPLLTQQVNEGEHFSKLRQIYSALILGVWFKQKLKDSIYKDYINKSKTQGIDHADKDAKEKTYKKYLGAFKKGAYDYTRVETHGMRLNQTIQKRQYFCGGVDMGGLGANVRAVTRWPVFIGRAMQAHVKVLHPAVRFKQGMLELLAAKGFGSFKGRTSEAINAYISVLKSEGARLTSLSTPQIDQLLVNIMKMELPGGMAKLVKEELPLAQDITIWIVDELPRVGKASALLNDSFKREGGLEAVNYPIVKSNGRYGIFVLRKDYKEIVMAHEFFEVKRRMSGDKPDPAHNASIERVGYGTKNEYPMGDSDLSANFADSSFLSGLRRELDGQVTYYPHVKLDGGGLYIELEPREGHRFGGRDSFELSWEELEEMGVDDGPNFMQDLFDSLSDNRAWRNKISWDDEGIYTEDSPGLMDDIDVSNCRAMCRTLLAFLENYGGRRSRVNSGRADSVVYYDSEESDEDEDDGDDYDEEEGDDDDDWGANVRSDGAMAGGAIGRWGYDDIVYDPVAGTLILKNPYRISSKNGDIEPEFEEFNKDKYAKRRDIVFKVTPATAQEAGYVGMIIREQILPVRLKVFFLEDSGDKLNQLGFYRFGAVAAERIADSLFIRRALWDKLTFNQQRELIHHEYLHYTGQGHDQARGHQYSSPIEPLTPAIKELFSADKERYAREYVETIAQNVIREAHEQRIAGTTTPPPVVLQKRVSSKQAETTWLKFLGEFNKAIRGVNTGSFSDNTGFYPKLTIDDQGIVIELIARGDLHPDAERRIILSLDAVNLNSEIELAAFIKRFNDELRRYPEWAWYSQVNGPLSFITKDPDEDMTLGQCRAMIARLQTFLRSCAERASARPGIGAIGNWDISGALYDPAKDVLEITGAVRKPGKSGEVSKQFLDTDGNNKEQKFSLSVFDTSEDTHDRLAMLAAAANVDSSLEIKLFKADEVAKKNRLYGLFAYDKGGRRYIFLREDLVARGNDEEIKEALSHEYRHSLGDSHKEAMVRQYQGGLTALLDALSSEDEATHGGINITKDAMHLNIQGKGNDFKVNNTLVSGYWALIPQVISVRDISGKKFAVLIENEV